jgi:hypothetical protein
LTRQQRSNSRGQKRKDISYISSPIAKDASGTLFYLSEKGGNTRSTIENGAFSNRYLSSTPLVSHDYVKITQDIENDIRSWLFRLKFTKYLSREFEFMEIAHDPYSNGILLAEIFCFLERATVYNLIQNPKTITECRENIVKVLSLIRQKIKEFPSRLLGE